MEVILHLYNRSKEIVATGLPLSSILQTGLFEKVSKMKYDIPNDQPELFDEYMADIDKQLSEVH